MKAGLSALAVGIVALLVAAWLSTRGVPVLQPFLPGWLFAIGIPLGALPLVMLLELLSRGSTPLAVALRRLLPALPIACLLSMPLLLHLSRLYAWTPTTGFAGRWWRAGAFGEREMVFLVLWGVLGLVFALPPRLPVALWRRALAVFGLLLQLSAGTLWALDWAMAVEPGLNSSAIGVLLLAALCSTATAAAAVIAAAVGDAAGVRATARPMLLLLGLWLFVQFSQYLIVWSANLPDEVAWYQHRTQGLGLAAVIFAALCCALVLLAGLPRRFARRVAFVAGAAVLVLALHAVEAWWLVNPGWHGRFVVPWADWLLLAGMGAVVAGCALTAGRRIERSFGRA